MQYQLPQMIVRGGGDLLLDMSESESAGIYKRRDFQARCLAVFLNSVYSFSIQSGFVCSSTCSCVQFHINISI